MTYKSVYQIGLLLIIMTSYSVADVFTSSLKMAELDDLEEKLLEVMKTKSISSSQSLFMESRRTERSVAGGQRGDAWNHPNGAYLMVKAYDSHWTSIIHTRSDMQNLVEKTKTELPTQTDVIGAQVAILRLQRVYSITASHAFHGNYVTFTGPALSLRDAYVIGARAFSDGMLAQGIAWLEFARTEIQSSVTTLEMSDTPSISAVSALLGRVYLWSGEMSRAEELYKESLDQGGSADDLAQLEKELKTMTTKPQVVERDVFPDKFNSLCTRNKSHIVERVLPFHKCHLKPSLLVPYVRYKEEILSIQPYVSMFYDVIYDAELTVLKNMSRSKFQRAGIKGSADSYSRTGDVGWIMDSEHHIADRVSRRVKDVTWLEVNLREPDGPASAEGLQVVNYGLGGHYSAHFDTFTVRSSNPLLQLSGVRIATFLMYLSDVELGGHTVFVDAGISVPPIKGAALFWYNVTPMQEVDKLTRHAGCPVLKGHKWIANKWIWTYGNTYRRPCGPHPESTQLDVERITYSRRHNIPV